MGFARVAAAAFLMLVTAALAPAGEWLNTPSFYSHDPTTGKRVNQYSPIGPVYVYQSDDYQQSGFRHVESDLQVGGNSDRFHVVQEWGRPVRPYGEWKYPFRPYSVPYSEWGPPYGGLGNPAYYPGPGGNRPGYDRGGPGYGPGGPGYGGPGPGGPDYGGPGHGGPNGPGYPGAPGF